MPNDPGVTSWLNPEYGIMNGFLQKVEPGQRIAALDAASRVAVDRPKEPRINVPMWNDVIRFGPREPLSKEDVATQRAYERAGLPSPLSQAKQDEIARRRRQADNMRNSAIPEYAQDYGGIMTAIDNVQDAALTASVAARIALFAAGRAGFAYTPFVAALWTATAILEKLGLLAALLGPAYSLYCQGPRDAISGALAIRLAGKFFGAFVPRSARRAGLPTAVPLGRGKGQAETFMWQMPGAKRGRAGQAPRWGAVAPSWAEALQAAQTGADWTGYGISLGAIMGMIGEIAYSSARAQRGETTGLRSPTVGHEAYRLLKPQLDQLGAGALWHRHLCARAVASSWIVLQAPELLDDEGYMAAWAALYVALEPLQWDFDRIDWPRHLLPLARGPYTPLPIDDPMTRLIIEERGGDPDRPGGWPLPGSPHYIEPDQLLRDAAPRIAAGLNAWLEAKAPSPAANLVAQLSTACTERLWTWLEGTPWFPRWELSPDVALWASLFKSHRVPALGDPEAQLVDFWLRARHFIEESGRKYLSPDELDYFASQAGIELIRTVGATTSVPLVLQTPVLQPGERDDGWIIDETVEGARARLIDLRAREHLAD